VIDPVDGRVEAGSFLEILKNRMARLNENILSKPHTHCIFTCWEYTNIVQVVI